MMCDGPFIFRRIASPRLLVTRQNGGQADFLHSLMNAGCDLARGAVWLGMRFHDERTARYVLMTGNYARFNHRGSVYTVDVEDNIIRHAIERADDSVRLIWEADIRFGWNAFLQPRRLGT